MYIKKYSKQKHDIVKRSVVPDYKNYFFFICYTKYNKQTKASNK